MKSAKRKPGIGASKQRRAARLKRSGATTAKGREIIESLSEALEVLKSGRPMESRFTVRTVEFPDEPSEYGPDQVRATRATVGVSQAIFASMIGVSTILIQSWERGVRAPAPWARRLLDEVNRDPDHWR